MYLLSIDVLQIISKLSGLKQHLFYGFCRLEIQERLYLGISYEVTGRMSAGAAVI